MQGKVAQSLHSFFGLPVQYRYPHGHQRQTADHIHDGMLFCEDRGSADEQRPAPGQHFQAGAVLGQLAAGERQRHAAGTLAVDGRADVDRGVRAPQQLHDAHGNVAAPDCFCCGTDVQAVGQHHVDDQTEGHARKHAQAELVVAFRVVPPEQRCDHCQQQKPAAIRENEPLIEGDEVVNGAVDDVLRVGDGQVQPEKPDQIHHPICLKPQMRLQAGAQRACIHVFSPIILYSIFFLLKTVFNDFNKSSL